MQDVSPDRAPALTVDLFSDVVCPWCFVGSERLERVLARLDRPVTVTHHPFMLDPNTPPEGTDIPSMLQRKYGVDPRRLWARVEAEGRKADLDLDLSKQRTSWPTARAHTLIRHALDKGTQRALVRALFQANFLEARNISDPAVLADVAGPHGFTAEEVTRLVNDPAELETTRQEAEEAPASGIHGVPFFVFNQRLAVNGAQPEEILQEAIARALSGSLPT